MLSVRSDQRGLPEADHLYLDHVGRHSFYGFLLLSDGIVQVVRALAETGGVEALVWDGDTVMLHLNW